MLLVIKKCGGCGVERPVYEKDFKHIDVETGEEWPINYIKIGDWNDRSKSVNSCATFYNLCPDCARVIDDAIAKLKELPRFKKIEKRKKNDKPYWKKDAESKNVEEAQAEFAAKQEDGDDGK